MSGCNAQQPWNELHTSPGRCWSTRRAEDNARFCTVSGTGNDLHHLSARALVADNIRSLAATCPGGELEAGNPIDGPALEEK